MEYIYAALLLHAMGKKINDGSVTDVLQAAGAKVDKARVKALVASLSDVDIDEAIKLAPTLAVAQAPETAPAPEEKKEEKKEKKKEEEAIEGLGALFK